MTNIARSTCTKCHRILPRTHMQQRMTSEYSGTSFGITNRGGKSARMYSRRKKYWICNDCARQSDMETFAYVKIIGFFVILFCVIILLATL